MAANATSHQPLADVDALLVNAAAESYRRIKRDQEKAPKRLSPLFDHLLCHLFESSLNAGVWFRACGIRDHTYRTRFHYAVGEAPYAYIQRLRLDTAARLLTQTQLPVSRIAELVGYADIQVFSRAFNRVLTVRPTVWRRQYGNGVRPKAPGLSILRRALRGDLDEAGANELFGHLVHLYPKAALSRFEAPR